MITYSKKYIGLVQCMEVSTKIAYNFTAALSLIYTYLNDYESKQMLAGKSQTVLKKQDENTFEQLVSKNKERKKTKNVFVIIMWGRIGSLFMGTAVCGFFWRNSWQKAATSSRKRSEYVQSQCMSEEKVSAVQK